MTRLRARVDPRERARSVPQAGATGPRPMTAGGGPPTLLQALPRILIIRTGSTAPEVQRGHGDYDRWFRDALAPHDLAFDLCDATKAAIPDASPYSGIIVTGSVKSVLKPEPWMDRLAAFFRGADHQRPPMLAVSFGCQMLAPALGGRVVLSPSGWAIGAVEWSLTAAGPPPPPVQGLSSPPPAP